jgi:YD repeat-containing protein
VEYDYDPTTGYRTAIRRYVDGPGSTHLDTAFSNFDSLGNPQTVTDPNDQTTTFTYDILSRVKTVTPPFPSGEHSTGPTDPTITFTYDVDGNLTEVDLPTDELGQPYFLRMGYDSKNRLTYLSDAQQNAIVYDYTKGRVTEKSLYTGFVDLTNRGVRVGDATFEYDTAGRLVKAFNPLFADGSVFTGITPDGSGNPVTVTDENSRTDNRLYDALNRLTQIQQIRSGTFTTGFGYDALSNVTRVTDAASKATDYTYDDLGRLVKVVSPDTGTTLYLYDPAGNLVTKIEDFTGSARTTNYTYDGLNRLKSAEFPTDPAWTFTYDTDPALNQVGRLASVTNGIVTTSLEYTARGKVAAESTTIGGKTYALHYGYDASGNVVLMATPSGTIAQSLYAGGRPQKLTVAPSGVAAQPIQNIAYLPFGPRIAADFPPLDGSGGGIVQSRREFNLRYQMTRARVFSPTLTYLDQS